MDNKEYFKQVSAILNSDHSVKPTYHEKDGDIIERHIRNAALRDLLSSMVRSKIRFDEHIIVAHIAETDAQKEVGLEVADSLDDKEGMLFVFRAPTRPVFHMGAVKFPIDIMFLKEDPKGWRVGKIVHNAQPGSKDRWSCDKTVAVLEVSGGTSKKLGIKVGATCRNIINVSLKNDISLR